jgi:hypothetical protein
MDRGTPTPPSCCNALLSISPTCAAGTIRRGFPTMSVALARAKLQARVFAQLALVLKFIHLSSCPPLPSHTSPLLLATFYTLAGELCRIFVLVFVTVYSVSLMMEGAAQKGIALRDAQMQQQVACHPLALQSQFFQSLARVIQPRYCYHVSVVCFGFRDVRYLQLAASVNAVLESSYKTAAAQVPMRPEGSAANC